MKKVWYWILCHILDDHAWTCKAEQGILPEIDRMVDDPLGYFYEYAQGYCKALW